MNRFNKTQLIADLRERADKIRAEYNFDPNNGYAQVERKSDVFNRAYGKWRTLEDLANAIEGGHIGVSKND